MRYSVVVSTLFAALALSSPVVIKEVVEVKVETTTVTGDAPPTPAPEPAAPAPEVAAPNDREGAANPNLGVQRYVVKATPTPPAPSPSSAAESSGDGGVSGGKLEGELLASFKSAITTYNGVTGPIVRDALKTHRNERARHGLPPLLWDNEIAKAASDHASKCKFVHFTPPGQGQNIIAGVANMSEIVKMWSYEEEPNYRWYGSEPPEVSDDAFTKFGHYSQVNWKGTVRIGCAVADCSSNLVSGQWDSFGVCNYADAGNFKRKYGDNVPKPTKPAGSNPYVGSWDDATDSADA
ncbi:MAG: hypothetical protein M1833_002436 [Piccolia ochrophora]|nr:MAG: hypothetical protein M1833_002436 [Piccolia ochrophora]